MLISLKARRKVSLMNTSKKVALTEAAQVQDQSHLTNGQDLKTDPDMVEDTTGTEASMTAAVTDVEAEAEVITRDLEVALITVMEGVVATTEVDEAEEDTMTGGIIVEEEVLCGFFFNACVKVLSAQCICCDYFLARKR